MNMVTRCPVCSAHLSLSTSGLLPFHGRPSKSADPDADPEVCPGSELSVLRATELGGRQGRDEEQLSAESR